MRVVRRSIPSSVGVSGADIDPYSSWNSGTTYALGDRITRVVADGINVLGTIQNIYESLQAGNLNKDPASEPAYWGYVSPVNPLKMFDQVASSQTISSSGSITATFDAIATANTVALLNCIGSTATVTVTVGGSTIYTDTQSLLVGGDGVWDWYEYFFGDVGTRNDLIFTGLPSYSGQTITVTLTGPSSVAIGTLMVGLGVYLGETLAGPRLGIIDYSKKNTDDFGVTTVVPRGFSKRGNFSFWIPNERLDEIANLLPQYRAQPAVWIGDDDYGSMFVLGFYREYEILVQYELQSVITIDIEGLS